jgi:hypothetical protein
MMLVRETEDDKQFQEALKTQLKQVLVKAESIKRQIEGGAQQISKDNLNRNRGTI